MTRPTEDILVCTQCQPPDAAGLARRLQTALDRGTWPAMFIELGTAERVMVIHALHAFGHGGHAVPVSQPIADLVEPLPEVVLETAIQACEHVRNEHPPHSDYSDGWIDAAQACQTALANLDLKRLVQPKQGGANAQVRAINNVPG